MLEDQELWTRGLEKQVKSGNYYHMNGIQGMLWFNFTLGKVVDIFVSLQMYHKYALARG